MFNATRFCCARIPVFVMQCSGRNQHQHAARAAHTRFFARLSKAHARQTTRSPATLSRHDMAVMSRVLSHTSPRARTYAVVAGVDIPLVGFGTYKVGAVPSSTTIKYTPSRGTCEVLEDAFSVGYRMLDCAEYYINEAGIGEAIAKSKIPRGDM
jgi:hypothetical protein